jgi:hypothetical protein
VKLPNVLCAWYVGIPRAGKTRLAHAHVVQLAKATGRPALVIDAQGADNFAAWPHVASLEEALLTVYGLRKSCAWTPTGPSDNDDVAALARAARTAKGAHLLFDEASFWLSSSRGRGGDLLRLARVFRHAETSLLFTTQHLSGDVPQEAITCADRLHVFRCTSPRALQVLQTGFNVDASRVRSLPQGRYLTIEQGFEDHR